MTVSSGVSRNDYVGNGVTTVFPVTFQFFEIAVFLNNFGVTEGVDYTVTGGNGDPGSVTFTTAPGNGVPVSIQGNTTIKQEIDLNDEDDFPADTIEKSLDRLTMISKDLSTLFATTRNADESAAAAAASAAEAHASEINAAASEAAAAASAASAGTHETNTAASEAAAAASATAADASKTAAATSETNAAASAATAVIQAGNAATSATAADGSKTAAAASASAAAASATAADGSKTAAAASATAADGSKTAAATSATNAANSAAAAAASAATAGAIFQTRALAAAATIPAGTTVIAVLGYATQGDCPITTYTEVADSGTLYVNQFRSNGNTRRWQIVDDEIDVRSVGMFPGPSYATANTTIFQNLINLVRPIYIPPTFDSFYIDGQITLVNGTNVRGAIPCGVAWTDTTFAGYVKQSRLCFTGSSGLACFIGGSAAGGAGLQHGSFSNLAIQCPTTTNRPWIFDVYSLLAWQFNNCAFYNASSGNPGIIRSVTAGSDPSWLNVIHGCTLRIPDASIAAVLLHDWSDSFFSDTCFTGGGGVVYRGPGNVKHVNCQFERSASGKAGFTVIKSRNSITSVHFTACDFDANTQYGLIISGGSGSLGSVCAVKVVNCGFRNPGADADVIFFDHATQVYHGPIFLGNLYTGGATATVTVNAAKWTVVSANNVTA